MGLFFAVWRMRRSGCGWAALAIFAIVTAAFYIQPLTAIFDRIPLNYNEGWNAYHAAAAVGGAVLYPPPDALVTNNYPPLSFYVVGWLGRIAADNIVTGRFVALASLLVVAANTGLIARAAGATSIASIFSALLLLAYAGAHFPNYVAMNDPQWLAQALATGGLVVFMRRRRRSGVATLAAPILMAAAIFTKQNTIALPLAVLIWSAFYDRDELRRWLIIGVATSVFFFGLCYLRFGVDFFIDVLAPRPYSAARILSSSHKYVGPLLLPMAAGIWLVAIEWRHPPARLLLLWAGFGIVAAMAFFGGTGVNRNVLFGPCIALCAAAGLLVSRLRARGANPIAVSIAVMLAVLPVLTSVQRRVGDTLAFLEHRSGERAAGETDIALLARVAGPVACEMSALCYWAGKNFEIDFFNTAQKILMGVIRPSAMAKPFEEQRYAAVVLTTNAPVAERPPATVMAQIYAKYRPMRISANGWTILVPASSRPAAAEHAKLR